MGDFLSLFSRREAEAATLLPRAELAVQHQLVTLRRIEQVMLTLGRIGMAPLSFSAEALDVPVVTVAPPADEVIDALENRYSLSGRFRRDGTTLWLSIDGVRVQWTIEIEPQGGMPRAA